MSSVKPVCREISSVKPVDRDMSGVKPADCKPRCEVRPDVRKLSGARPDDRAIMGGAQPDDKNLSEVKPDDKETSGIKPNDGETTGVKSERYCRQCSDERPPRTCRRPTTTPSTTGSSHWPRTPAAWLAVVAVIILAQLDPVRARHQAKVHSSHCSYTLVINEFDVSKCPVMQADAKPGQDPRRYRWGDSPGNSRAHSYSPFQALDSQDQVRLQEMGGSPQPAPAGGDRQVDVLKSQIKDLESRLLEEMVRSRELNSTLARHTTALDKAEKQLTSYTSNFTAIYRAIMFVQRQMQKQRRINKSLNKKLSNVLLDVMEVNNVLTRMPVSPQNGGKATTKDFEVQSVAEVRACPGLTDKSVTYRGR